METNEPRVSAYLRLDSITPPTGMYCQNHHLTKTYRLAHADGCIIQRPRQSPSIGLCTNAKE